MPSFRERITSALKGALAPSETPLAPASVVKAGRDEHAGRLTLDDLCRVMRPRSLAFARAFLSAPSATEAARRAGYGEGSIRKTAVRLLRDPYVRRYIELARIETTIAERASLVALRAELWSVSRGEKRPDGSVPTAAERANARSNLTRILVALQGLDPGAAPGAAGGKPGAAAGSGEGGWTEEAIGTFEREVLGVDLGEDDPAGGATG